MIQNRLAKRIVIGCMGGFITCAGISVPAFGKSPIPGTFSPNVALTSEYYFRGLSQTDDAPAIQGGFDWEIKVANPTTLYLGIWGSNVDFNEPGSTDGATIEIDLYGGLKGKLGRTGLNWDVGFIYYAYPGAASSLDYDFWEIKGALGYDFGVVSLTGSINYTVDNFGDSGEAAYTKLAVEVPVTIVKGLTLSGHIAEQYIENASAFGTSDYIEWNLGATYSIPGLFDVSVNYSDTDIDPDVEGKDEAVYFTVSRSF